MLSIIVGLLSAGSGGLFGILGSIITTLLKQRAEQKEHKREIERQEMMIKVADNKGSWDGLTASQQAATQTSINSSKWSNDVKNVFRPFITTVLVIGSYFIFRDLMSALTGAKLITDTTIAKLFDFKDLIALVQYYVNSMVFATSAAIMWWFGDRAQKPPGFRNL